MDNITKLLFSVLFSATSFYATLEAKQLRCDVSIEGLNAEGILQPQTLRSYKVNTSAVFSYVHHDGNNGREENYNKQLGPYVVKELFPLGKIEAEMEATAQAVRESFVKLGEECRTNGCNCAVHGCACLGIGCDIAALALTTDRSSEEGKFLQEKEMKENIEACKNPVVLKNIKDIKGIKVAQNAYLCKHYKEEILHGIINIYTIRDSRYIHIIGMHDETGQVKMVFFDMTDTYKKIEKRGNKSAKMNIKELMARHEPVKK